MIIAVRLINEDRHLRQHEFLASLHPTMLRTLLRQPVARMPAARMPAARMQPMLRLRSLSTEIRGAIDSAVNSAPVVLFMKGTPEAPQCGFSRNTIQILGYQGVDPSKFAAYNVLEDPELRDGIKEYSSWPTIPQLYINKEFVGGHDIIVEMSQDGTLADLLEKEGVLIEQ